MAYAWMPGVKCIRAETDGGPLRGGAPRAVWLTLGAKPRAVSVQSAAGRLNAEGRACHLVWDPVTGEIAQLISVLRAGRALGTPEHLNWRNGQMLHAPSRVNTEGRICVQIGVLARMSEPFTDEPMPGLAAILSWLDSWNVPRRWPSGAPAGDLDEPSERDRGLWARGGHFGASQVPECESLGPGRIDTDLLTGGHLFPVSGTHSGSQHPVAVTHSLAAAAG